MSMQSTGSEGGGEQEEERAPLTLLPAEPAQSASSSGPTPARGVKRHPEPGHADEDRERRKTQRREADAEESVGSTANDSQFRALSGQSENSCSHHAAVNADLDGVSAGEDGADCRGEGLLECTAAVAPSSPKAVCSSQDEELAPAGVGTSLGESPDGTATTSGPSQVSCSPGVTPEHARVSSEPRDGTHSEHHLISSDAQPDLSGSSKKGTPVGSPSSVSPSSTTASPVLERGFSRGRGLASSEDGEPGELKTNPDKKEISWSKGEDAASPQRKEGDFRSRERSAPCTDERTAGTVSCGVPGTHQSKGGGGGAARSSSLISSGEYLPQATGGGMKLRDFRESRWMRKLCEESLKFHLTCGRYRDLLSRHVLEKFRVYAKLRQEAGQAGERKEQTGRVEEGKDEETAETRDEQGEEDGSRVSNCEVSSADQKGMPAAPTMTEDKSGAPPVQTPRVEGGPQRKNSFSSFLSSLKESLLYPLPPPVRLSSSSPLIATPYRVPVSLVLRGLLPHPPTSPSPWFCCSESSCFSSSSSFHSPNAPSSCFHSGDASLAASSCAPSATSFVPVPPSLASRFEENREQEELQQTVFERLYANRDAAWCRRYFLKYQQDFDVSLKTLNRLSVLLPLPILKKLIIFHSRIKRVWPLPILAWMSSSSRTLAMRTWGAELDALERRAGEVSDCPCPPQGGFRRTGGGRFAGGVASSHRRRLFGGMKSEGNSASSSAASHSSIGPCRGGVEGGAVSGIPENNVGPSSSWRKNKPPERKRRKTQKRRLFAPSQQRKAQTLARGVHGGSQGEGGDRGNEDAEDVPELNEEGGEGLERAQDEESAQAVEEKEGKQQLKGVEEKDEGEERGGGEEAGTGGREGKAEQDDDTGGKETDKQQETEQNKKELRPPASTPDRPTDRTQEDEEASTSGRGGATDPVAARLKTEETTGQKDGRSDTGSPARVEGEQRREGGVPSWTAGESAQKVEAEQAEKKREDDDDRDGDDQSADEKDPAEVRGDSEDEKWQRQGFAGKGEAQIVRDLAEHLWSFLEERYFPRSEACSLRKDSLQPGTAASEECRAASKSEGGAGGEEGGGGGGAAGEEEGQCLDRVDDSDSSLSVSQAGVSSRSRVKQKKASGSAGAQRSRDVPGGSKGEEEEGNASSIPVVVQPPCTRRKASSREEKKETSVSALSGSFSPSRLRRTRQRVERETTVRFDDSLASSRNPSVGVKADSCSQSQSASSSSSSSSSIASSSFSSSSSVSFAPLSGLYQNTHACNTEAHRPPSSPSSLCSPLPPAPTAPPATVGETGDHLRDSAALAPRLAPLPPLPENSDKAPSMESSPSHRVHALPDASYPSVSPFAVPDSTRCSPPPATEKRNGMPPLHSLSDEQRLLLGKLLEQLWVSSRGPAPPSKSEENEASRGLRSQDRCLSNHEGAYSNTAGHSPLREEPPNSSRLSQALPQHAVTEQVRSLPPVGRELLLKVLETARERQTARGMEDNSDRNFHQAAFLTCQDAREEKSSLDRMEGDSGRRSGPSSLMEGEKGDALEGTNVQSLDFAQLQRVRHALAAERERREGRGLHQGVVPKGHGADFNGGPGGREKLLMSNGRAGELDRGEEIARSVGLSSLLQFVRQHASSSG